MKNLVYLVLNLAILAGLGACSPARLGEPYAFPPAKITTETVAEAPTQGEAAAGAEAESETHRASSNQSDSAKPSSEAETPPASLIEDLKTILATEDGILSTDVLVKEVAATEWSDSCLGVPRPEEACAQVITPGYRIILSSLTETFEFHTDRTGRSIRRAGRIAE